MAQSGRGAGRVRNARLAGLRRPHYWLIGRCRGHKPQPAQQLLLAGVRGKKTCVRPPCPGRPRPLPAQVGWELLVANVGDSLAYLDTGSEVVQVGQRSNSKTAALLRNKRGACWGRTPCHGGKRTALAHAAPAPAVPRAGAACTRRGVWCWQAPLGASATVAATCMHQPDAAPHTCLPTVPLGERQPPCRRQPGGAAADRGGGRWVAPGTGALRGAAPSREAAAGGWPGCRSLPQAVLMPWRSHAHTRCFPACSLRCPPGPAAAVSSRSSDARWHPLHTCPLALAVGS